VEAAHDLGISVKRLDGWEPAERTEYEYDRDGRLVASTTVREPEWDEEQQSLMLALHAYRANIHEACGHYLPDSTSPEADEGYGVGAAIRCHACTARAQAYGRYSENQHPEALLFPVRRKG
jgi:hypothetical protein